VRALKLAPLRRLSARLATGRLADEIRAFRADAALCTHFLPLELLGHVRARDGRAPLTVSCVTDFEAHALWQEPGADLYCVAAEETKARLVARGVEAGAAMVTGIPVSRRFWKRPARAQARRSLGLDARKPVVLLLGGGFGLGPVERLAGLVDSARADLQLVVVCGRNEALKTKLEARPWAKKAKVFGFVTDIERLMAASDLLVTKPGGLTSSEALALGRPLLIVDPIPGQESANSDFLLERGAAVKANRLEDVPYRLDSLLGTPRLAALSAAAKALGRPKSGPAVVDAVLRRLR
jgi:processive 1,2-diacylglycerol beta-glucosyltransferase